MTVRHDVAIVGGGLAGLLLARQLRRQCPEVTVAIYERAKTASSKVGESTVELASNYLVRRLGLSRYLYEHHLPKNGLRFFFDNESRDAPLESMSEIGSVALAYLPSFQLDRARFENDMWEMNLADGVECIRGKVSKIELDADDEHSFEVTDDSGSRTARARWLIDASGRASLLAKKLKLRTPETHAISAVWGRFTGVVDLDDVGSEAFRGRVKHTSRVLSTNHFCYPGYWIWLIPLRNGITSVGVVIERERFDNAWRTEEGFREFLDQHGAVRELLSDATPIDTMSLGQLAYGSTRYFGRDRWAVIGEAASFSDPFYSPGSDFIAMENDFVADLVSRDHAGEDAETLGERIDAYDDVMVHRFDTTMKIYRDQYSTLGSYDLYKLKWDFDIACYYNLWLEPYFRDEHLDLELLNDALRQRRFVNVVMENFGALFSTVEKHLVDTGAYRASNLHAFTGDFPTMRCAEGLGQDESRRNGRHRMGTVFNLTRTRAYELLGRPAPEPLPLSHFLAGKPLL